MSSQKKSPALLALEAAKATKANREMRLNRKTIPFEHRRGSYEQAIEEYAEFDLFQMLCVARDVEIFVNSVFYDTNMCCFEIELSIEAVTIPIIEATIKECAHASLTQFSINGEIYHKVGMA